MKPLLEIIIFMDENEIESILTYDGIVIGLNRGRWEISLEETTGEDFMSYWANEMADGDSTLLDNRLADIENSTKNNRVVSTVKINRP